MKKFIYSLFAILILTKALISFAHTNPLDGSVTVLATSHNIFYFKICKNMVGGQVEVYNASGEVVRTQNLDKCKLIVDFIDLPEGDYKIKIIKNCFEEIFDYHRSEHVAYPLIDSDQAVSSLKEDAGSIK